MKLSNIRSKLLSKQLLDNNDGPSTPKASFDKTGAATLGVMCVAFVLLVGGNAILIIGAHKRKRAREQRRRIFRSFIDS